MFRAPIQFNLIMQRVAALGLLAATALTLVAAPVAAPIRDTASPAPVVAPTTAPISVPIIQLRGDAAAIGRSHGRQLGPDILLLQRDYLHRFIEPSFVYDALATESWRFVPFLDADQRAEIKALAAGSGCDQRDALFAQCFLDLVPMFTCSTISVAPDAAPDHVARFGRNLDFPSLGLADRHVVLFIYHPQGRYAFAAIGFPGTIGVLSGMNEHGLTLACMEVLRLPRVPSAEPYTLLYRQVLERCRTVDEAVEFLRTTPRQTSNNLMLMDAAGDRAVVELSPDLIAVRRALSTAALISTNHQRGANLDDPGRCWRFDRLHDESRAAFGRIDVPTIEKMLHDARQRITMQSMIFEPVNRVLYLSVGPQATNGPYRRIELQPLFDSKE
jgi:isopenicillin-N N-acyltransferase like protein